MPLTDTAARNAKPAAKPYKLADEKALYLLVNPNGAKWWRLKYRFGGKEKLLALGVYPDVGLKLAREKRDKAREVLAAGIDPSDHKRQEKAKSAAATENTFEAIAREWLVKQALSEATRSKALWMFEALTFPWIGAKPIADIKAPDVLAMLRRIEARGKLESARRVKQQAGRVFRYAVSTGRALDDPTAPLREALATPTTRHHASLTDPKQIGALLLAIEGYSGSFVVAGALKLAPLLFVRPGELRHAEWSEIDFDAGEWRIPAEKMKMRAVRIVSLSQQAIAALRELQPHTGRGRYVFPGVRSSQRPMSENGVLAALRYMGYGKEQMTGHGFRSMASTRLHEMGWNHHVIERQLAHGERDKVAAAYNYAEHLPERRKMMQAWADYLDALKDNRNVVAGNFGRVA